MTPRDTAPYSKPNQVPVQAIRGAGPVRRRMMREPTPQAEIYLWHWKAVKGLEPEIHEVEPEAGWFKMRLTRGGPFVPVEIWVDQEIDPETGELTSDELLCCTVNGFAKDPAKIWTHCRPISRDEFDAMKRGETGAGSSEPMQKVNLMMKVTGPNG